jgi:penicillin-binding protein-related factor A (putative recombinase)
MTKFAVGYVVYDGSSTKQKIQYLENYCRTQGKCCMFKTYWTSERDYVKPLKNMIRYINKQKDPTTLVFWAKKDIPRDMVPEVFKLRAKGCEIHFMKY